MRGEGLVPRSVGRAFELLELVVAAGAINLTAAAQRVGLTPTTALRHLRALEALGYVHRHRDAQYSAGPAVLRLATAAREQGPLARLIATAQPVLADLAAATGESSYLAVADGDDAVYLATCESDRAIRHVGWVGKAVPLAGTAVGAALLGAPGPQHRTGTIEADISAVALAVADGDEVVAALSVIGPAHRMDEAAVTTAIEALTGAVVTVGRSLGLASVHGVPA